MCDQNTSGSLKTQYKILATYTMFVFIIFKLHYVGSNLQT